MVDLVDPIWKELLEERPVAVKQKLKKNRPAADSSAALGKEGSGRKKRTHQIADVNKPPLAENHARTRIKRKRKKRPPASAISTVAEESGIARQHVEATEVHAHGDCDEPKVAELTEQPVTEFERRALKRRLKKIRKDQELTQKFLEQREQDREAHAHLNVRKIFVGGMNMAEDVKKLFGKYGEFENFSYPNDKEGRPMGIAFITFKSNKAVEEALKLDGSDFAGRRINVKVAEHRDGGRKAGGPKGKSKGKGFGHAQSKGKGKGKRKGKGGNYQSGKAKAAGKGRVLM